MFAIITGSNHTVQNCKGEFIIKELNKHQMTIISKETIPIIIIILNNPLVQHTLVINFSTILKKMMELTNQEGGGGVNWFLNQIKL